MCDDYLDYLEIEAIDEDEIQEQGKCFTVVKRKFN